MAIRRIHQGIEALEPRTLLAAAGPYVVAANPADIVNIRSQSLTTLTINFNEAVNASSFTDEDVKIVGPDGPITLASIDTFDDQEFTIEIPAQTRRGIYSVTVGPQITDLGGNAMDQNKNGTAGEAADGYAWSFSAFNADIVFTTGYAITAGNKDYETQDIAIIGATLTIDGSHSFHSVQLMKGAVLTHTLGSETGIDLTIADDVIVDQASVINADAKGYSTELGSGPGAGTSGFWGGSGAGYGGRGSDYAGYPTGGIYGSVTEPLSLGSAGGGASGPVGAGGGLIKLHVAGMLSLAGSLSANGGLAANNVDWGWFGGGGSGGSIYVSAGILAGPGTISANGGGVYLRGGGGGGGRIALRYAVSTFRGTLAVSGGVGDYVGGAGTICTKSASQLSGDLLVQGTGYAAALTAVTPLPSGTYNLDSLEVTRGATLQLPPGTHTIDSVKIASGANMNVPNEAALEFRRCDVQSGGSLSMEGSCADDPGDILDVEKEGTLTLDGNWTNKGTLSARGTATLQGTWTNEAAISIDGPGTLQGNWANNGSISVGDVTVMQEDWVNSGTISVDSVAILKDAWTNTGIIAVTGQLIVRPPQDAILSTYATVHSQLRNGVLGKIPRIWTNVNEDAQPYTAVGSFFNGYPNNPNLTSFAGQSVQKGDVLLKYVYDGDANMDGVVNADDYFRIDSNYIPQNCGWYNGDFNYDNVINADDYFLIDSAFLCQGGPLAGGEPEPAEAASEQLPTVTREQPQKNEADQSILAQLFSTEPVM